MAPVRTLNDTIADFLASGRITQEELDEERRRLDASPVIRRARRGLGPFVVKKLNPRQT
jgi:hypothetical protein